MAVSLKYMVAYHTRVGGELFAAYEIIDAETIDDAKEVFRKTVSNVDKVVAIGFVCEEGMEKRA